MCLSIYLFQYISKKTSAVQVVENRPQTQTKGKSFISKIIMLYLEFLIKEEGFHENC